MTNAAPLVRGLVPALALTVSVAYGALFYGFSVLVADEAAGADFSTTVLSLAFGGSVLTGGLAAVWVGRWADRSGIRPILLLGGLLGGIGLCGFAAAQAPWQVLAIWWGVLGPAAAMTFYEPAYVAIDQWFGADGRVRAIATLTLMAGLSGPVSIPVTGALVEGVGWRWAGVILGVALAGTCGIVALLVVPQGPGARHPHRPHPTISVASLLGDRRLVAFTAAAFFGYGAIEATVVHRVARFEEAGFALGTVTLWAAISGLLTLPGRFLLPSLASRVEATTILASVFAIQTLAVAVAIGGTSDAELVVHFALFGLVFGATAPLRALAMGNWYSGPAYGRIMGAQAGIIALGRATAPATAGALRDATSGYEIPVVVLTIALGTGAVLTLIAGKGARRQNARRRWPMGTKSRSSGPM